jgi:hypothetical protein
MEFLLWLVDVESMDNLLANVWKSIATNGSKNKSNDAMTIKLAIMNWCQDEAAMCKEDDYLVVNTNMVNMFCQLNFISSSHTNGSGLSPFNLILVQHPVAGTATNCADALMVVEGRQLGLTMDETTCFYQALELHIPGMLEEANAQLRALTMLMDVMWSPKHQFTMNLQALAHIQPQIHGLANPFMHQPHKAVEYASHVLFTIECKIQVYLKRCTCVPLS